VSESRDYTVGNRRGYVTSRPGREPRIVIEIGCEDVVMSIRHATDLASLIAVLLRESKRFAPGYPAPEQEGEEG
jgi:hypothetical protein